MVHEFIPASIPHIYHKYIKRCLETFNKLPCERDKHVIQEISWL